VSCSTSHLHTIHLITPTHHILAHKYAAELLYITLTHHTSDHTHPPHINVSTTVCVLALHHTHTLHFMCACTAPYPHTSLHVCLHCTIPTHFTLCVLALHHTHTLNFMCACTAPHPHTSLSVSLHCTIPTHSTFCVPAFTLNSAPQPPKP